MAPLAAFTTIFSAALSAHAWGNLGHETIGFVAEQFLAPKAATFVHSTLNATWNFSLGPAAIWADQVKGEQAFKWSADLHFVDAQDSPLTGQCSVEEERDCADQICILAAIANYTARVVNPSLAAEQTLEALLFIVQFVGDIGQPLHVEALEEGGNGISAVCSGESSDNLHAAWDTGMVTKHIDQMHGGTPQQYANDLVAEIKNGSFASLAASWLACSSTTEPLNSRSLETRPGAQLERDLTEFLRSQEGEGITPLECPIEWARESNAFDCTVVFNFTTGEDLCSGVYFNDAVPVIDLQLAKQGFRLAAWLNVLFDGATNLP
ncbi:nuclease Le1 [Dichomitus squalens LYAD-421 SS1]|uniref:Nuclease Le1 n=1 Tax=Dichomitus squalens (strain LYAD-421) TaxID=732165 RepID=R7SIL4_DICSQ|nr:nuclease Le1 [Dichomitus squalens LYAD-421 SS1]EJF55989.1 nuclease Le1 [Dichomitus squalens LYAD-421 SS1]